MGGSLGDEKREQPDADDDEAVRHAADEPTAVWDANTLREAGLGDLINKPESLPPPPRRTAKGNEGPSIVVDEAAAGAKARQVASAKSANDELSWGATIGLAAGLGAAVYVLIRLLK